MQYHKNLDIWWGSILEAVGIGGMILEASTRQEDSLFVPYPYQFIFFMGVYALGRIISNQALKQEIREDRKELSDKL